MADEFDDLVEPLTVRGAKDAMASDAEQQTLQVARLASRLYSAAAPSLRPRLLACLLRPLGTLGAAAVAAGAFAGFMQRGSPTEAGPAIADAARISEAQIGELARFVVQVSPEALQEFARLVAERPLGIAAFSASAAMLLMQRLGSPSARSAAVMR
jgi:hypothetical protein